MDKEVWRTCLVLLGLWCGTGIVSGAFVLALAQLPSRLLPLGERPSDKIPPQKLPVKPSVEKVDGR